MALSWKHSVFLWIIDRDFLRPNTIAIQYGLFRWHAVILGLCGVFVLESRSNNRNNQNTNDLKEAKQARTEHRIRVLWLIAVDSLTCLPGTCCRQITPQLLNIP